MDLGRAIAIDPAGNVYVTGSAHGTVDLGGGPLPAAGDNDLFVASFAADGTYRWAHG